jgi:hypothetical protein
MCIINRAWRASCSFGARAHPRLQSFAHRFAPLPSPPPQVLTSLHANGTNEPASGPDDDASSPGAKPKKKADISPTHVARKLLRLLEKVFPQAHERVVLVGLNKMTKKATLEALLAFFGGELDARCNRVLASADPDVPWPDLSDPMMKTPAGLWAFIARLFSLCSGKEVTAAQAEGCFDRRDGEAWEVDGERARDAGGQAPAMLDCMFWKCLGRARPNHACPNHACPPCIEAYTA